MNAMNENTEYTRKKGIMMNIGYAALVIAIYVLCFRYVIYVAWPFVFALLFAEILRRPSVWLSRKIHINEKLSAGIVMLVFYIVFGSVAVLIVLKAFWSIVSWVSGIPTLYTEQIEPFLEEVFDIYENYVGGLADVSYLNNVGNMIIDKLGSVVSWLSSTVVNTAKNMAVGFPKALLGFIFMVISSFFISMDFSRISRFFMAQLKPNQQQIAVSTKEYLGSSIGRLIFSYGIIMIVTFCELNIGLRLLHIANPTIVALIIAIFDILPALGTGGIVIPWIIIEVFSGHYKLAFGLLIMYLAITVIRNIIEPKIVGDNLGVHPVLMLMSIYLGAFLLGGFGIVILPFTIIVIKKLNDSGLIHAYVNDHEPKEEGKEKRSFFDRVIKKKDKND